MSTVLKVQERGQVTLPKDVRDRLKISSGDLLVCSELDNGVIQLVRLCKPSFEDVFGDRKMSSIKSARDVDAAIKAGREHAAEEVVKRLDD